ncbi:response regulator FixJ [Caulobacter sp. RHG1]|uniref:response regulator FixJ n=1 Tax=Caulobacter sp. (strain RHG1) TaxID=2545762 RepID=UPI0015564D2B|nr:response regulator FixJ [Caulobacter sp. RHG1]NQE61300.1 Two-component nitrogen fixation transcriptional regulator FixJ [Caulobacter sp. RHG1]
MSEGVVHIVDDDAAMRDSLGFLLQVNRIPFRLYDSAVAFLDDLPADDGGCVLTDVRMPEMTGIEMVRLLKGKGYRSPMIVMTGHADVPLAIEAMKAGVVDFLEKPFEEEVLLRALRSALELGHVQHDQDVALAETRRRVATLSPRERDVLKGLVEGKANKVIAFDHGISPRTVEIYRASLMTKMQAKSLSELVRMALSVEVS